MEVEIRRVTNETFSTYETAEITGLTPRQLQWRDENGDIKPKRSNKGFRRYSPQEVLLLLIESLFKIKGADRETIRRVLEYSRNTDLRLPNRIKLVRKRSKGGQWNFFFTVSNCTVLATSNTEVMIKFIANSTGPVYTINLNGPEKLIDSL